MKAIKVGIVGFGPRGLTLLERIVAHERDKKTTDLEVYLFDPNEPGVGCHDPSQPGHFLVNTVACQITQFSDPSVREAGPILEGPSFYQWLQADRVSQFSGTVSPDAYYSRSLFGRYLHWVYKYLCRIAPAHLKIHFIRSQVDQAHRAPGHTWLLDVGENKYPVDYLFLTTGHTKSKFSRSGTTSVVEDPYPIQQTLSFIKPGMAVGIEGLGLAAFDVLAELTVGRGGRFAEEPTGALRYLPSGQEPRIVAFSRSGVPLNPRAANQKGVSTQYRPRFLHLNAVRKLRAERKLDFQSDILPLLIADMEYAYYEAYLRERRDTMSAIVFCSHFAATPDAAKRAALVALFIPATDRFSWERLASPVPGDALVSRACFKNWLLCHLRADLLEASKGNVDSPLKAACDVLRDLRDNLRAVIDFGGLTEVSHRWLYAEFLPVMNRLAVGPPAARLHELIALMEAGILCADLGPGASCELPTQTQPAMRVVSSQWPDNEERLDALVRARISTHSPEDDASPLMRSLLDAGHLRLFKNGEFHPGGIEVDNNFNWITKHGEVVPSAWALGLPTEGAKFYTFVVPRPGVGSTAVVDAGRAVGKMLSLIAARPTLVSQY